MHDSTSAKFKFYFHSLQNIQKQYRLIPEDRPVRKLLSKNQSTVQEYFDYLGMVWPMDFAFIWVCHQMMLDPLPPNVRQYVNMTGEVYWNDAAAKDGVSFWKHPHYDKYRSILEMARTPPAQAPVRLGAGVEQQPPASSMSSQPPPARKKHSVRSILETDTRRHFLIFQNQFFRFEI